MKTIMRGLTLAAVLLTGAVTQAELVIDAFLDTNNAVQNNNTGAATASGTRTFFRGTDSSISTANMNVLGSAQMVFAAGAANRNGTFTYNFTSIQDIHSSISQFVTGFSFSAAGNYLVTVTASDSGGNDAVLAKAANNGTGFFSFTGADFGNGAILSAVKTLAFTVQKTDAGSGSFTFTSAIKAVPEPATMSLLGLTAIGGIFAHRRRKNQLAA